MRKFYGVIHEDLHKGNMLRFDVTHRFNTYDFGGSKQLMFTTQARIQSR